MTTFFWIAAVLLVVVIIYKIFGGFVITKDDEYEIVPTEEGEKALAENLLNYRQSVMVKYCNFILNAYNGDIEKNKSRVEAFQSDINEQSAVVAISDTLFYVVNIDWASSTYVITASFTDDKGRVQEDKIHGKIKRGVIADLKSLDRLIERVDNKIYDLCNFPLEEQINEIAEITRDLKAMKLSEQEITQLLYSGVEAMGHLMAKKKFSKNKKFLLAYTKLFSYLTITQPMEFMEFLKRYKVDNEIKDEEEEE